MHCFARSSRPDNMVRKSRAKVATLAISFGTTPILFSKQKDTSASKQGRPMPRCLPGILLATPGPNPLCGHIGRLRFRGSRSRLTKPPSLWMDAYAIQATVDHSSRVHQNFLDSKEFEMPIHRRTILSQAAGIAGILSIGVEKAFAQSSKGPLVIATWPFGLEACKESLRVMNTPGKTAMDGVEAGIRLVEADLTNRSVGIGGDPNSEGVLQLDACVMDGHAQGKEVARWLAWKDSSILSLWLASSWKKRLTRSLSDKTQRDSLSSTVARRPLLLPLKPKETGKLEEIASRERSLCTSRTRHDRPIGPLQRWTYRRGLFYQWPSIQDARPRW